MGWNETVPDIAQTLKIVLSGFLDLDNCVMEKMQATNSRFRGLRATIEQLFLGFLGSEAKETEGKGRASLCERLLFGGGGRV